MTKKAVIYIHPRTPMVYRSVLPVSLPALVKRVPYPLRGFHAAEVTDEEIRAARVIIVDIHWYLSLKGAKDLLGRIKRLHPGALVIAGGLTATLFARRLAEMGFDFVIRGDGEIPLPALVKVLLDGGDLEKIPNLVGPDGFETSWSYVLGSEDLDENDFFDLDFFPSAKAEVRALHAANPGWPTPNFPWLLPFRGCPVDCPVCVGSTTEQKKSYRRAHVIRSPRKIAEDLDRLDKDTNIRFVNCLLDYLTLLPESYAREALPRPTDLLVYHELAAPPSKELLDFFLSRFRGGNIRFCVDSMHLCSDEPVDHEVLAPLIEMVQARPGYTPILVYNGIHARANRVYRDFVGRMMRATGCFVADEGYWWTNFPRPGENGEAERASFDRFLNLSRKDRFFTLNGLVAVSRFVDRLLPAQWAVKLRRTHYRIFQGTHFRMLR